MTAPTNTFTVTFADAHAHTLVIPAVPGNATATDGGKADALLNVLQGAVNLSAFTPADTLTVTVTQP